MPTFERGQKNEITAMTKTDKAAENKRAPRGWAATRRRGAVSTAVGCAACNDTARGCSFRGIGIDRGRTRRSCLLDKEVAGGVNAVVGFTVDRVNPTPSVAVTLSWSLILRPEKIPPSLVFSYRGLEINLL